MDPVRIAHQRIPLGSKSSTYRTNHYNPHNPHPVAVTHVPSKPSLAAAPRIIPVLQPPVYPKRRIEISDDNTKENRNRKQRQPILIDNDRKRQVQRKISIEMPVLSQRQNYPKQPILRRTILTSRYSEPKYSSQLYLNR